MQVDDKGFGGTRQFEEATREEVLELVKQFGSSDNMKDAQNDSPTMEEFLALADTWPAMRFHGYIVDKPRDDFRVTIEGFTIDGLNEKETLVLVTDYKYADECNWEEGKDGKYSLRTWWD